MAQTIYGIISDNGDGSSSMHWFRDGKILASCLSQSSENYRESFLMNEGSIELLNFSDEINLEKCGFSFSDSDFN